MFLKLGKAECQPGSFCGRASTLTHVDRILDLELTGGELEARLGTRVCDLEAA